MSNALSYPEKLAREIERVMLHRETPYLLGVVKRARYALAFNDMEEIAMSIAELEAIKEV